MAIIEASARKGTEAARPASSVTTPPPEERRTARTQQRERERFLRRQVPVARPLLVAATLAGLGVTASGILQSFALATAIFTGAVQHAAPATVARWLVVLGVATLLKAGCAYLEAESGAAGALRIQRTLREKLLVSLLAPDRLVAEASAPQAAAHAHTYIEQVDRLERYYARYLPQFWLIVHAPLLFLVVIFPANWVVGLILLVVTPIIPLYMALIGYAAEERSSRHVQAVRHLSSYFLDRLRGLATLRRLGAQDREVTRIEAVSEQLGDRSMDVLNLALVSSAVLEFFSTVAIAIAAIYVGFTLLGFFHLGVPRAGMTLQSGIFLLLLAASYFQPLRAFAASYHDRADALAAAALLLPLLGERAGSSVKCSEPSDSDQSPISARTDGLCGGTPPGAVFSRRPSPVCDGSAPSISLRHMMLCYPGQSRPALDDISLDIAAGEMVALTGPSGAGKSSVLALLTGLVDPSAGELCIGGAVVTHEIRPHLRTQVSWIGQRPYLFPGTLAANIAFGRREVSRDRIEQAARQARVLDFAGTRFAGLDAEIGERGGGLSAGEAQRVALARAFLRDTPLLLLDEPTASLDPTTERDVLDTLLALARGRTVVIATHSPALIARCRWVVRLEGGRVMSSDVASPRRGESTEGGAEETLYV